jgi:type III restriction enzyme
VPELEAEGVQDLPPEDLRRYAVAPNVIVYLRLEKDFGSNRIFHELPLIPPEWRSTWSQKVILRGESTKPGPSGNLFLTNIH